MQGAFLDAEAVNKTSSNLSADDLLELLNTDQAKGDKAQSGVVSDKVRVAPSAVSCRAHVRVDSPCCVCDDSP